MRISRFGRWLLSLLVMLVAIALLLVMFLPWERIAEKKLIAAIEQAGMTPATLSVTGVGLHGLALKDVALGEPALILDNLSVAYSARGLLQHDAASEVTLHSENLQRVLGDGSIVVGDVEAILKPGKTYQDWSGTWEAKGIKYATEQSPFPELHGAGEIKAENGVIDGSGSFEDASKAYNAKFTLHYEVKDAAKSFLTIQHLRLPWNAGVVATQNVRVPLDGKSTIRFTLNVQKVSLSNLLQVLTGDKATATGVVSGNVPVVIDAKGKARLGKGALKADAPGVITLSPEVIPGDNPQVGLVRELMKNLQYSQLGISFDMDNDKLTAHLLVEGRNPDVEQGRPVKLNVNLTGDLLDLIMQNVTLMSDPKTFIENNSHEKP